MKPEEKAKIRKGLKTKFKILVADSDTPNIYIRNKKDDSLYAKIWIYQHGDIEVRRFMKEKDVAVFIKKDGKIKTEEFES